LLVRPDNGIVQGQSRDRPGSFLGSTDHARNGIGPGAVSRGSAAGRDSGCQPGWRRRATASRATAIEAAGYLWSCNGCKLGIARQIDADLALVDWMQKVSNLILNLNVVIRDAATRKPVLAGSVDIRGDTDESWRHGMRYLIPHRLLLNPG
jgi:Protein of unknown function (DUF2380)